MKKTVVLGATDNPSRYAYKAVHRLKQHGHEVVPVGIKKAEVRTLSGLPSSARNLMTTDCCVMVTE